MSDRYIFLDEMVDVEEVTERAGELGPDADPSPQLAHGEDGLLDHDGDGVMGERQAQA